MAAKGAELQVSLLFSTWLAPAVYDAHADDDAGGDCVGADCFADAYVVTGAATLVGFAASAGLALRTAPLYRLRDGGFKK